jgi:methyl-galactoside transport system substrate-binding protein
MKKHLTLALSCVLALALLAGCTGTAGSSTPAGGSAPASQPPPAAGAADLNVAVFYYSFADVYISSVRALMDAQLDSLGLAYQNYDGNSNQTTQTEQVTTAITNGANLLIVNIVETSSPDAAQNAVDAAKDAGIPIIFFNREVADEVVQSYEQCAFVGTDAAEAGHMQGKMIADFLLANYDAVDLNGDGVISYVMFKGQEGNAEAEYRTQYAVEDADAQLAAAGKPALAFYDANNASKYLVDQNGNWSAAAATEYMETILAEYTESSGKMIEMVIANNDNMAEGAVSALATVGYNLGDGAATVIPVFGVDAVETAKQLIVEGKMAGTVKQDAEGMAKTIAALVQNISGGSELMAGTDSFNVDSGVAKIRVPYGIYTGE